VIVFDLQCSHGHVFEAWFGSSADYEQQRKAKLIECPVCGDQKVGKALMAPNVAAKGNRKSESTAKLPVAAAPEPTPAQTKEVLAALAEMQAKVEASFENVGGDFPEEVRKIHYGEADARGIYGEATAKEAKELWEEGIDVLPLPFQRKRKRLNA
jgi:hypothetical protein